MEKLDGELAKQQIRWTNVNLVYKTRSDVSDRESGCAQSGRGVVVRHGAYSGSDTPSLQNGASGARAA